MVNHSILQAANAKQGSTTAYHKQGVQSTVWLATAYGNTAPLGDCVFCVVQAYRVEPLINPSTSGLKPVLVPHYKGRKRLHLGE